METKEQYRLELDANYIGTSSYCNEIGVSYIRLLNTFGEPLDFTNRKDLDGKVSTMWIFRHLSGQVVTLYDLKETSLYEKGLPSPKKFRKQRIAYWHIGARSKSDSEHFEDWAITKLLEKNV